MGIAPDPSFQPRVGSLVSPRMDTYPRDDDLFIGNAIPGRRLVFVSVRTNKSHHHLDSVTSAPQCIRQRRSCVYLKEGTYHTRLFRGPSTNGMKK